MTCKEEGCINNTRWPNRSECWRNGLCPEHYWNSKAKRDWRHKNEKRMFENF